MGKKYTPSGYQIINIDVTAKTSGTAFTPETEDEKLLHEILSSKKSNKPVLLTITGTPEYDHITGFAVFYDSFVSITGGNIGSFINETIAIDGTKLQWDETVE